MGSLLLASLLYFFGGMKKSLLVCIHSLDLCFPQSQNYKKKILVEICPCSPRDICYMDPIFPYIYNLIKSSVVVLMMMIEC